jgi:2-haloacid dehalogenase
MYRAVVFDAYGTLFDVHSVAQLSEECFPGKGTALSQLWRAKQLEYTWLRSLMGRYDAFDVVTEEALRVAGAALGLQLQPSQQRALMAQYLRLTTYPDVKPALRSLAGRKLAILSNGSPAMLEGLMESSGLKQQFSAVLSVDTLRIYKPHPRVYQLAVDELKEQPAQIAFVSSNFWDAAGATSFGFRTYWINRSRAQPDELGIQPGAVLASLSDLASCLS